MLTLSDAVLEEDIGSVKKILSYGEEINQIDEYGFTPLIEAAIVDHLELSQLLLEKGANPTQPDMTGGTALHWAAENNNADLCRLLLKYHADPNAYTLSGQPVLVMPTLRHQIELKQVLIHGGADEIFAQDYIHTKLLGHLFELTGMATIVDPKNHFVEVDFEGFFLEITIGLIADSLAQFRNHFASRPLRRYAGLSQFIVEVMKNASELIQYQQYRIDINRYQSRIDTLIQQEPLIIPVGYEGHAITFIRYGDIWIKCDRREDSRLYDNIMFYRALNHEQLNNRLIKQLFYEKKTSQFINQDLHDLLGLEPMTELKIESQISGNCSWANVEAVVPSLFFILLMQMNKDKKVLAYYKTLALNFFHQWRDWNKERTLDYCIQSYKEADSIRKTSKAEMLAAILFQHCRSQPFANQEHIETILSLLMKSPYEYLIKNYLRVYYYEEYTAEGKQFAELLKEYGY